MKLRVTLLFVLLSFMLSLIGYFAINGFSALRQHEGRSAFDSLFLCLALGILALFFLSKILKECRGAAVKEKPNKAPEPTP